MRRERWRRSIFASHDHGNRGLPLPGIESRGDREIHAAVHRSGADDRVGNKLTQNINDPAALTSVDELYGYDELYRLTQYDRGDLGGGSIFNPTLTQDWTLDATGNWTDFIQGVTDALNQDRTHNQVNEITDITESVGVAWPTPAYDDNGNTTECRSLLI